MKQTFTASISQEDNLYIAQCLEVDVVSQGTTKKEALQNLVEALQLHFEEPQSSTVLRVQAIEVDISAA